MPTRASPDVTAVTSFLSGQFRTVSEVARVERGVWSAAFTFVGDGRHLVARFGEHRSDYDKDQVAATWSRPALPIPAIVDIGEAFDMHYAVSERAFGEPLEDLPPDRARNVVPALLDAIAAMRTIEPPAAGVGHWSADGAASRGPWGEWLVHVIDDYARHRLQGWRDRLRDVPAAQGHFDDAYAMLADVSSALPDVRHVVHADLGAGNVLVEGERIAAIFDWGASIIGDPLYEIAWFDFWSPWHAGWSTVDVVAGARERFADAEFDLRLLACGLHVGLAELAYLAHASKWDDFERVAERLRELAR